jgi:MerR family transcriptional regulator, light-induced transcriptional regulator
MANIVGVSTSALRAWERRYQILKPKRTPGGHRIYTPDDIKVYWYVCYMRDKSGSNSFLKDLSLIGYDEILKCAQEHYQASPSAPENTSELASKPNTILPTSVHSVILENLKKNNVPDAIAELESLYVTSSSSTEFCDACLDIMAAVGDAWHGGEITAAVEHALTSRVKHLLLGLLYLVTPKKNQNPVVHVVCATLSGEMHELGLLRIAIYLKHWGCTVTYIGANTPLVDLQNHVEHSKPHILCLSVSQVLNPTLLTQSVQKISMLLSHKTTIVLGGSGIQNIPKHLAELKNIVMTESPQEFEQLVRIIDSFLLQGKKIISSEIVEAHQSLLHT